jgi:glycosyltransferase involved in cell wall biosynthesis
MPFFTVVIPLFNKENYVQNTIASVLNQSFQDFELIVVEDCSTDNSKNIVRGFHSDKIKIIQHTENKGLSASRNTGIKSAAADYIAFLDADDLWKPNYLEKIYSLIQQFPMAGLYATNYEELYPDNRIFLPVTRLKTDETDLIIDDFFHVSLSQTIYCCCSLCVKKTVFETIGYYDENITFAEDVDFNIRANFSNKLAYSNEVLVSYIMHSENQITNNKIKNKTITDFDSYEIQASQNPSLKKYLDFNRYMMAKYYKLENNLEKFKKMRREIHPDKKISGLNYKQLFLMDAPVLILKFVKHLKIFLMKYGIKPTIY